MMRIPVGAVFGLIMALLGSGLLLNTYLGEYSETMVGVSFGPMFYPRILLCMWVVLSLIITVVEWRKNEESGQLRGLPRVFIMAGMIFLTIAAMEYVGFLLSTLVFFFCSALLLGYRNRTVLILTGICFPVGLYFTFQNVLNIVLP